MKIEMDRFFFIYVLIIFNLVNHQFDINCKLKQESRRVYEWETDSEKMLKKWRTFPNVFLFFHSFFL